MSPKHSAEERQLNQILWQCGECRLNGGQCTVTVGGVTQDAGQHPTWSMLSSSESVGRHLSNDTPALDPKPVQVRPHCSYE